MCVLVVTAMFMFALSTKVDLIILNSVLICVFREEYKERMKAAVLIDEPPPEATNKGPKRKYKLHSCTVFSSKFTPLPFNHKDQKITQKDCSHNNLKKKRLQKDLNVAQILVIAPFQSIPPITELEHKSTEITT